MPDIARTVGQLCQECTLFWLDAIKAFRHRKHLWESRGIPAFLDDKLQIINDDNFTLLVLWGNQSEFQHNVKKGESPSTRPSSVTP